MIFIWSIRTRSVVLGRVVWILYAMYYFILYIYGYATIYYAQGGFWNAETIPYILAIIGGIVMFFGVGQIRNWIFKGQLFETATNAAHTIEEGKLLHKIHRDELHSYNESD